MRPALLVSTVVLLVLSTSIFAQAQTQVTPKITAFYQLVSGAWAQISNNATLSLANAQLNIAALQCNAIKKLDILNASEISAISATVSQKLSKVILYQKLPSGLKRIDFGTRSSLLFPKLVVGKIKGGKDGFEISNKTGKITIAFAKIKQRNRSWPVMIEGRALYLKCP